MSHVFFRTLRARLVVWFLLIAAGSLGAFGGIVYAQRADFLRQQALAKLEAMRELKIQRIVFWLSARTTDIDSLGAELFGILTRHGLQMDDAGATSDARVLFRNYLRFHPVLDELSILDGRTGRVVLSTSAGAEGELRMGSPYFAEAYASRQSVLSDIHDSPTTGRRRMTYNVPISSGHSAHEVVAVLAADFKLEPLDALLQERMGLGETGETLILNHDAVALNQLRYREGAPLRLKVPAGTPGALASQGQTGAAKSRDYRDVPVLAAYGPVPRTGWGFVAKQDLEEVEAPIQRLAWTLILVGAGCLVLATLLATVIAKSLSDPLKTLRATVDAYRAGNRAARTRLGLGDEIGILAKAFDTMADEVNRQQAVRQGAREVVEAVTGSADSASFCENVLRVLLRATASEMGVFYRMGAEGQLTAAAWHGVSSPALVPVAVDQSEGAFGDALVSLKISHLKQVSADTRFLFRTIVGTALPCELLTIPLVAGGGVAALIALASLREYSAEALAIVDTSVGPLAVGLHQQLAHEETRCLAAQLSQQNVELQAQKQELQAQQVELERQSMELAQQNVELTRQATQVAEANRLKSEFLSNMSHELRTPLNSVLALSRVLGMQAATLLTQEQLSYLDIIERNGKHLLSLINDVLDLAKIEAGRVEIACEEVSIAERVGLISDSLRPICTEKGIALTIDLEPDLPPVHSDGRRIHDILQNIVGNAVKFTLVGAVRVTVRRMGKSIHILVADTGIGISEKDLPHVFEEFRQADGSPSRAFEGTGLGLAIASKSVELLGGRIDAQSRLGVGSTFTIILPIGAPRATVSRAQLASSAPPMARLHALVLVVDGHPDDASLTVAHLRRAGYPTVLAATAQDAMRMAETHRPAAIVIDVTVPGDCSTLVRALRENPHTASISILLTSRTPDAEAESSLGVHRVLAKPLDADAFLSAIRAVAPLRRLGNRLLLVEDSTPAILQLRMVLETAGYQVELARNGREALEKMTTSPPDAIILDLMMPEIDGLGVLEQMRSTPATRTTPVLILTAKDLTEEDLQRLSANHVQQLVQKGDIDRADLLRRVECLLTGSSPPVVVPATTPHVPEQRAPRRFVPPGAPTILAVEDNPDNMIALRAALHGRCTIREASDGLKALEVAQTDPPDLILLDLSLPQLDGLCVIRRLRADPRTSSLPVVALTAHAMSCDRQKALDAGCDEFLTKPLDIDLLVATLQHWLGPLPVREAEVGP